MENYHGDSPKSDKAIKKSPAKLGFDSVKKGFSSFLDSAS
jgi:hypothetical protein